MINSPKYALTALKSSFLYSIQQDYIVSSPTERKNAVYTLKWRYIKDGSVSEGDDRGSVDFVQWSGSPPPDPTNWDTITYTYDPAGRRIKRNVVGSHIVKYVYDGGHVIAEYDDSSLLRKYIYGARVDEPVCMLENPASDGIDVADSNAAYYYHFDGLGSVVALSNSNGDSCQSYEYSAYGQVAASDPNHPNPYMFTGRRFDIEIRRPGAGRAGLYYYRARYYNPHIGRFMQTDPVGYDDGINWYLYCRNNPLNLVDPSGLSYAYKTFQWITIGGREYYEVLLHNEDGSIVDYQDSMSEEDYKASDWYVGDVCDVCDVRIGNMLDIDLTGTNANELDDNTFLGFGSGPLSEPDRDAILNGNFFEGQDITRGKSIKNIQSDKNRDEFEQCLLEDGWMKSPTSTQDVYQFEKNGAKFVTRPATLSGSKVPTADFYPPGSSEIVMKIRLH